MDIRILWNKDPALHRYYLSADKKRFFKCYNIDKRGRELFEAEINVFKKVQFSSYFPKLYSFKDTGSQLILEMEFIPAFPLTGHLTERYNNINPMYSREQIDTILKNFDNLKKEFTKLNLIKEDKIMFKFVMCHIIFDYIKDRIVFIDLSDGQLMNKDNLDIIDEYKNEIKKFSVGNSNLIEVNKNIYKDLFLLEKVDGHPNIEEQNEIYSEGESLLNDLKKEPKGLIQHTICINDKKFIGHRCHFNIRDEIYKIPADELVGKTVLDLGCNIGGGLVYFAERGANKIIGIENHPIILGYLSRFISYCKKIHGIYNNIEIIHGDLRNIEIPESDVCFYLSGLSYYGTEKFNKMLSQKTKIVYLEGHSDDIFKNDSGIKKVIEDFGDNWQWEFLGRTENEIETSSEYKPRPVYKGIKKNG